MCALTLTPETAAAVEIARRGGAMLLARRGGGRALDVRLKGPTDPVTDADVAVERYVREELGARFPDDAVLGEETADDGRVADRRWHVDPLDGTVDFISGLPGFAVSIACDDGALASAAVYAPALGELFVAERGAGAWVWRDGQEPTPLAVSATARLREAVASTGVPYETWRTGLNVPETAAMMRAARAVRIVGGSALHLSYVAAGRLDLYWEPGLQPYDAAAGVLLVREAGGSVTAMDGALFELGGPLLATNGRLHRAAVEVLAGAGRDTGT